VSDILIILRKRKHQNPSKSGLKQNQLEARNTETKKMGQRENFKKLPNLIEKTKNLERNIV